MKRARITNPLTQYSDDVLLTTAKSCGFDEHRDLAGFLDEPTPLSPQCREELIGHLNHVGPTALKIAADTHKRHQDPEYRAFLEKMRAGFEWGPPGVSKGERQ